MLSETDADHVVACLRTAVARSRDDSMVVISALGFKASMRPEIVQAFLDAHDATTPPAEPSVEQCVSMDEKDFMAAYAVTKFMAKLDCKIGRWLVRCIDASLDERERAEAAKGGA